jgi:hypothetical protein
MGAKTKNLFIALVVLFNLNVTLAQNGAESFADLSKSFTDLTRFKFFYKEADYKRAKEVMQNNEFEKSGCSVQVNPLAVDGKALDYGTFDLNTKGVLSLFNGQAETKQAQNIPFYVYVRRNGEIIEDKTMTFLNKELYKINLSDIFSFCKNGDLLIIKPARAEDWMAKRILKLLGGC